MNKIKTYEEEKAGNEKILMKAAISEMFELGRCSWCS
jgi:hypothetical protein